jgi:hypothetical protein
VRLQSDAEWYFLALTCANDALNVGLIHLSRAAGHVMLVPSSSKYRSQTGYKQVLRAFRLSPRFIPHIILGFLPSV